MLIFILLYSFMLSFKNKNYLFIFRLRLLRTIALMAFVFSTFIATLALFHIFPLTPAYMLMLYGYGVINLSLYSLLNYKSKYYLLAINILIISSLLTFTVMTITVIHDEFRLVWFFLTSFGAFILAGKHYGLIVTFLITLIVIPLYIFYDINLSPYAVFTFFVALILFNTFACFFLKKIENDSKYLEDRVKEEVKKQQMQEEMLLRQYRMANMGCMIDAIAHQWRQPLMQSNMALLNLYDAIESNNIDKSYVLNKLEELGDVTIYLSQTIEDFRTLLDDDKKIISINIDELIKEVFSLLSNNLKGIELDYSLSNIFVLGFKSELIQVFIILLSNSIEALNENKVLNKYIYIGIEKIENSVNIYIEDNAGGIKNTIIDKVFDPYFTTKKEQGGSGLGLYITKIMVEQNMQGKLTVSNTSKGAKFTINLKGEIDGRDKQI